MSPSAAFEIAELADLTIDQLVAKFEVVHQEKCRSRNRNFIVRRIAWRIQANEEGGLSERALLRAGPIADESVIRVTPPKPKVGGDVVRTKMPPNWDPRIPPPGSFVERRYKGKIRRVLILTDGFEYEDERFDSLADCKIINPHVRVIGLTATPFRLDSGMICSPDHFLNEVCYEIGIKELIRDGYLSPLISKAGVHRADFGGLHIRAGEFVSEEVESLVNDDALVSAACAEIVELTADRRAVLIRVIAR